MSKPKLPIFGEPIYRISVNNLSNRIKITDGEDMLGMNSFQYFAVDAIQVTGLRYEDSTMERIIINENTDLELLVEVKDFNRKDRHSLDIFTDIAEAYSVCRELNLQKRKSIDKIAQHINKCIMEFDNIVAATVVPPKV